MLGRQDNCGDSSFQRFRSTSRKPGPGPELSRGIPAPPEIQQQGRGGCGSRKVTWPQQLLRTSRSACQGRRSPGTRPPGNGLFPISLSGVTGSRLAYNIRQDFQVKRLSMSKLLHFAVLVTVAALLACSNSETTPVPTNSAAPAAMPVPSPKSEPTATAMSTPTPETMATLRPTRLRLRPPRQHPSRPQRPGLRLCRNRQGPRERSLP